jgi:Holliday junction DNA helicase RuvA
VIDRLRGKLLEKSAGRVVVEVGGLGLSLQTPLTTFLSLPNPPSEVTLMVRLIIREESWDMYGFLTPLEKDSFDILTSVTRVGPKLALTIISSMKPGELGQALISQDLAKLASIKGIGLKTAERLIVELKDKAGKLASMSAAPGEPSQTLSPQAAEREEAINALIYLGYTKTEAEKAANIALKKLFPESDLETIIREALKSLSP